MQIFTVQTSKKKQVLDITQSVNDLLKLGRELTGYCQITVLHTTCSLTTADLDPGTDQDMLDAIERMFPIGSYRHQHDPGHVGDHIMSSLFGPSVSIPVKEGKLLLGMWQRLVVVELSGPRTVQIAWQFTPEIK